MNNSIYAEVFLRKKISYLYILFCLFFLIMIVCILFILNVDYNSILKYKGIIKLIDTDYYLVLNVKENDVEYFIDNFYLKINDKDVFFKVYDIDEEIYSDGVDNYKVLYLKVKVDKKYKVNNLNLDIKINKENKKIIYYIIDYLKER